MARRRWNIESIKQVVAGENPIIQFGYTPKVKKHKIGDVWTDVRGKTWKKTKSGKVSVNKQIDSIREIIRPSCSGCGMDMHMFGDRIDDKLFAKTGKCFACLELEETTMKMEGKYEEYEKKKLLINQRSIMQDLQKYVEESIDYLKKEGSQLTMVCSNGVVINWDGGDLSKGLKVAEEDLIKIKENIETLNKEIESL